MKKKENAFLNRVMFFIILFCTNVSMYGQMYTTPYRDSIINSSMELLFLRHRDVWDTVEKIRRVRKKYTFDILSLPYGYIYKMPDNLKYNKDIEFVNSSSKEMIKRYKRSREGVPTIIFNWYIDEKGRIIISYSYKYIYIRKKMKYEIASCTFLFIYRYSNSSRRWILEEIKPKGDYFFQNYMNQTNDNIN